MNWKVILKEETVLPSWSTVDTRAIPKLPVVKWSCDELGTPHNTTVVHLRYMGILQHLWYEKGNKGISTADVLRSIPFGVILFFLDETWSMFTCVSVYFYNVKL